MKYETLVLFLDGTLSPETLAFEIADEVASCNEAFKSGDIGYIVISDGPLKIVTRDSARRLLAAVAFDRLPFELANYVSDCIIMSDDFEFEDDIVRDAINFIEDDSRPPTHEETLEALRLLD
ncbi:hypothetical protein Q1W73_15175 [Asticcacaulis sp. ZE23SCel15]|uniref:hypothetical protein n=1 Tax=Asticcacaulis sp. ZE23SCel15 TaxID=3059027 RepID=UPI00265DD024|nr:hypothetical protein [Asticcacaulis sp. ZE23SCel15]WKL56987.1 hypothetical protein Q1W73_15175 [Asticcacaulis sp. ZE23SCel15]